MNERAKRTPFQKTERWKADKVLAPKPEWDHPRRLWVLTEDLVIKEMECIDATPCRFRVRKPDGQVALLWRRDAPQGYEVFEAKGDAWQALADLLVRKIDSMEHSIRTLREALVRAKEVVKSELDKDTTIDEDVL